MDLDQWKLRCPYGKWVCADGREVLFNRQYWPILERRPGEKAKPARSGEWVHNIVEADWFFTDSDSPWAVGRSRRARVKTLERCNQVLAEWNYPPLPWPPRAARRRGGRVRATLFRADIEIPPRVNPYAEEQAS